MNTEQITTLNEQLTHSQSKYKTDVSRLNSEVRQLESKLTDSNNQLQAVRASNTALQVTHVVLCTTIYPVTATIRYPS